MKCRHCAAPLSLPLIDLGSSPPSNAYLSPTALHAAEPWFPLRVLVCTECWLAQTEDYARRESLFAHDYAYFSSFSASWLAHARRYVEEITARCRLDAGSMVAEIAANDGYLLQYVMAAGIPCYGIEPTANTAAAAREKCIEIVEEFFGVDLATRLAAAGKCADLVVANNVLAHVPDINDFAAGVAILLKPEGTATFEFPHLVRLVAENQFDTIYHEHFSYLSLVAVDRIFATNGLRVVDVEELPSHGGSLRVFAVRADLPGMPRSHRVDELLQRERSEGVASAAFYSGLQGRAERVKDDLLYFLIEAKRAGKKVGAYGAAAKGNTLLNFAGVRRDLLPWVADRNPAKQGQYLPGSRIPVVEEAWIRRERPDYLLVLPWNLHEEIERQLAYVGEWGCRLVRAVPSLMVSGAKLT